MMIKCARRKMWRKWRKPKRIRAKWDERTVLPREFEILTDFVTELRSVYISHDQILHMKRNQKCWKQVFFTKGMCVDNRTGYTERTRFSVSGNHTAFVTDQVRAAKCICHKGGYLWRWRHCKAKMSSSYLHSGSWCCSFAAASLEWGSRVLSQTRSVCHSASS